LSVGGKMKTPVFKCVWYFYSKKSVYGTLKEKTKHNHIPQLIQKSHKSPV